MLSFASDYTEGAHPKLLQHFLDRNMVTLQGYGFDEDTDEAKRKICLACGRDDLQIQFLTGGTQTNLVAIASMLKSYEGVVCAQTGHISVHEAGAIGRCAAIWRPSSVTRPTSTWSAPAWSTSPTRRSSAPSTRRRSSRPCLRPAGNTASSSISTGRASATA